MIELAIFIVGSVTGGLVATAAHWLLQDEEHHTEDSIDAATSLTRQD
jgi:hypothetical protein